MNWIQIKSLASLNYILQISLINIQICNNNKNYKIIFFNQFVEGVFEGDDLLQVGVALRQLDQEQEGVVPQHLAAVNLKNRKKNLEICFKNSFLKVQ